MPRAQSPQKNKHVEKTLEPEPTGRKKKSSGAGGSTGRSNAKGTGRSSSGATSRSASGSDRSRAAKTGKSEGRVHEHRTAKVVELVASSTKGFEDAIQNAVADACESIHGIHGCDVRNMSVSVRDGKISEYKVDLKLAFGIDRSPSP